MGAKACKYCNNTLSPLRSLTDGEFCCDEHRQVYQREKSAQAEPQIAQNLLPLAFRAGLAGAPEVPLASFPEDLGSYSLPEFPTAGALSAAPAKLDPAQSLLRLGFDTRPAVAAESPIVAFTESLGAPPPPQLPQANLNPVTVPFEPPLAANPPLAKDPAFVEAAEALEAKLRQEAAQPQIKVPVAAMPLVQRGAGAWQWFRAAWHAAPMELKAMTFLLPVLLAVAGVPLIPKLHVPPAAFARIKLANQWKDIAQLISHRAAIAFNDDFRSGLDNWESRSNLTSSWSYDTVGFVQPGPLALYKPTLELKDYRFEFLGEIEHKALGCAFRAQDLDNYYALKFTEVKSGPLPSVRLVRYAVINGKEGPHTEKQLPLTVHADTMYRVAVETRGNDFIITAQGEMVDFFSDGRLPKGGVGFFSGRGEKARLRWVSVSHQYDTLGRLCAFLVPYGLESLGGS
jgi:hypothetical protein